MSVIEHSDAPCSAESDGRGCVRTPGHSGAHVYAGTSAGREVVRLRHQLQGAVAIADELRALGQEWREEWPDGRVCKAALNEIADRLAALGEPS